MGSLVLQPAVLHPSFKGTYADGSLHKRALLLDPRMDNWGQGTFTLFVSRLYRRAIGKANQEASPLQPWLSLLLEPFIQDMMEEYISHHG
jgi:hypothetical protein